MARTITLYDGFTGFFTGVITGEEDELKPYLGMPHLNGLFNKDNEFLNIFTKEVEPLERRPLPPPLMHELRNKRDELLNDFRWTVMPDSPLTVENQVEWLAYLKSLQRLLKDVTNPSEVVWPDKPGYIFEEV